jgi:hypothetical protein
MNIDSFNKIVKAYKKKFVLFQIIALSILASIAAIFIFIFESLDKQLDTGNIYLDYVLPVLPGALLFCTALSLYFYLFRKYELGLKPNFGYHCPHCNAQLVTSTEAIIATGNCPHCGKKVIDKEEE